MKKQGLANPTYWESTSVQNLYRRQPSGTYYALAKVAGKQRWQSLRTTRMSDARERLAGWLKEQRSERRLLDGDSDPAITFKGALDLVMARVRADPDLRPASRRFWEQCYARVLRIDPRLTQRRVRDITEAAWHEWAETFRQRFSAWTYSKGLQLARKALDVAVRRGALRHNSITVAGIRGRQAKLRDVELPTNAQFHDLVTAIREGGSRHSQPSADMVELLAYTGLRKGEAGRLAWEDVDLSLGRLTVRQAKTEAGERVVPLVPDARSLLERMKAERGRVEESELVSEVRGCQRALARACALARCQRLTHHDLRRYFTTRCIEAGVDIPTIARWLGHVDGGALLMRVYGRLRLAHSERQAALVTFNGGAS